MNERGIDHHASRECRRPSRFPSLIHYPIHFKPTNSVHIAVVWWRIFSDAPFYKIEGAPARLFAQVE